LHTGNFFVTVMFFPVLWHCWLDGVTDI